MAGLNYNCWCYECLCKIPADGPMINSPPDTVQSLLSYTKADSTFIVCPTCHNKRCPKATDHRLSCTNSNESNQLGSRYGKNYPHSNIELFDFLDKGIKNEP